MPFEYWEYQFEGAFKSPDSLKSKSGVYVIWCEKEGNWTVLDVGESANVKERVKNHHRADCWAQNCSSGTIYYSATYTPSLQPEERIKIEQKIRNLANPICGNR